MSFPSVVSRTTFQGPSSDAASAAVLSAVDLSGGAFAVAIVASDGAPTLSVGSGSSSGWSKYDQSSNSANNTVAIFTKTSPTSSETLNVASDASEQFVAITYLVDGADSLSGSSATGSSGACNPPSHDAGASRDHLWLAVRAPNTGNSISGTAPTGYSNLTNRTGATTANTSACLQVADKTATAQTEDPGTFGSTGNPWIGWTLAIWDSGGSGGITGTLAASESGSDTFAASGTVAISGSLSASEIGSDSLAASGQVLVSGALAASETGSDTLSATGTVGSTAISGSLAVTEAGSDTFAGTGDVLISGALDADETGADTFAGSGAILITGTLDASESGSDSFSAEGTVRTLSTITGTLAAFEVGSDFAFIIAHRDNAFLRGRRRRRGHAVISGG